MGKNKAKERGKWQLPLPQIARGVALEETK
jgi:hypothetical protein